MKKKFNLKSCPLYVIIFNEDDCKTCRKYYECKQNGKFK